MLFIVLTCCHTTSSVHWYRAVLIVAISVGRPNTPDSRQQVHVTFVLITCCRRCLIEMLLCPVRPCCRAICIVGHCPPARPCHWFCCHFKGRGQKARHLRQGGVRHGARSPRAEWRHDAGRRCQNRLIDPELEYAAITNNAGRGCRGRRRWAQSKRARRVHLPRAGLLGTRGSLRP